MTTANERATAGTEVSPGTVCLCTADDRPALTELYLAAFPNCNSQSLAPFISDAEISLWAALKNDQGDISVALHVTANGSVVVVMHPDQAESPEGQQGFVRLATEVFKVLKPSGIQSLAVIYPPSLRKLGEALEREGFLSQQTTIVRAMYFTDSGEVARVS